MARIAAAESLPVRITVIGTMSGNIRRNRLLQVTGAYERATLSELVGRIGPDLFVLPSIWPETFSYAAEEVMLLGYPLAVFDLGAPAERASAYARGLVVGVPEETDEQAARRMLDAIVEWARACGLSNDGLA
jgi:glycosyltransferase involved in cell wall biosynthesis